MAKLTAPFILVDGSSYLFRAYYALPALTNSQGLPTGAIYGVLNMLRKLINDYHPENIAVVFDSKGSTFRHEIYKPYKANRAVMPDDLQEQIQPLHDAIAAMGLPIIVEPGVEADDIIGTLALQAEKAGQTVLISTGDKDLAQLVNQNITLVNTMTSQLLDVEGVKQKFGVAPEQIIDYLVLVGDTVDNISGVAKVGPKTAVKWLSLYNSLANIEKHADEIKGKVGENLRAFIPKISLTKELVTIKTDVSLNVTPQQLVLAEPDKAKLQKIFTELEFKKWLAELGTLTPTQQSSEKNLKKYQMVLTKADFKKWVQQLKSAHYIALDTETTNIDAMQADLVGISFACQPNQAAYVPLAHDYSLAPKQLDKQWVLQQLQPLLIDKNKIIIGQNLKYDLKILCHESIEITAPMMDTLLESYVLNSSNTRHDLTTLAEEYLSHKMVEFSEVAGKGKDQLTFNQVPLEKAVNYAAEDADVTLQLHQKLHAIIEKTPWAVKILQEIELPLMPILAKMEYDGVLIDAEKLKKQSSVLAKRVKKIEAEVYQLVGSEFNLSSPKQLQEILYQQMKLPVVKKTPTGQPSTAENVLQELAQDFELPKLILEYRSLTKIKSTYTDKLPQQINSRTGRVHTHYNQVVTATGRLSSNDPNLQNIPARSEEGHKIRQAFIAPRGYRIIAADYSQIELRVMAHLSKDSGLLKAFEKNLDVHSSTAAELFNLTDISQVTSDLRRRAKAINFGLMYGMSSFGVAQQLAISRKEAQAHIDTYFSRYPGVKKYMEAARLSAAKQGYVETLMGRRLNVRDIKSKNFQRRLAAERAAINAPLQGTAAEIIKLAMIKINEWIKKNSVDIKMIMQVHDELVFEVHHSCLQQAQENIQHCMENAVMLSVPLIVSIKSGMNWDEAH